MQPIRTSMRVGVVVLAPPLIFPVPRCPGFPIGSIAHFDASRVEFLDAKFSKVGQSVRKVGRGSSALLG